MRAKAPFGVRRPASRINPQLIGLVGVSVALVMGCVWWLIRPAFEATALSRETIESAQQLIREEEKKVEQFVQSHSSASVGPNLLESLSKHSLDRPIPVQIHFHRLISRNQSSYLTCALPVHQIREACNKAKEIWKARANIELVFDESFPAQTVSDETDREYTKHVIKYTTRSAKSAAVVSADLVRIIERKDMSPWEQKHGIHIYCMGVFVGNNAVTEDQKIFIRTVSMRKDEAPMDTPRFTRVLAHEIGHTLDLGHPKVPFCLHSCVLNQCNLMCQQKIIPKWKDPRFAHSLSLLQVAIARQKAGSLDISSTPLRPGQSLIGVPTETISNAKPVQWQLILFSKPVRKNVLASKLRLKFSRFTQCNIALVSVSGFSGDPSSVSAAAPLKAKIHAWASLSPAEVGGEALDESSSIATISSSNSQLSKLQFASFDLAWWTEKRHVEASIEPPVKLFAGEYWGLYFSSPQIALAFIKDVGAIGISRATLLKGAKSPTENAAKFRTAVETGSFTLEGLDPASPDGPIMNLVAEDQ